jgi:hypothetical protein
MINTQDGYLIGIRAKSALKHTRESNTVGEIDVDEADAQT